MEIQVIIYWMFITFDVLRLWLEAILCPLTQNWVFFRSHVLNINIVSIIWCRGAYEKLEFLLTFTYHKAEEEADFSHVSDGELAHRAQHGLVVLGSGVGHAGQFGLQGLRGGQLTHLHDITKTHPLLFGSCWEVQMEREEGKEKQVLFKWKKTHFRTHICILPQDNFVLISEISSSSGANARWCCFKHKC